MYQAIEDMLSQLEELDLIQHLIPEQQAKSREDEKFIRYIRIFRRLHPKILAERRVSRTDIFDVLFGDNREAISIAHKAYNSCYKSHYGEVFPFQDGVYNYLSALKKFGPMLGVATNRSREFLDNEFLSVDNGRWRSLFNTTVCGDEVDNYKPAPDMLFKAVNDLNMEPGAHVWYVGDSLSDMIAASAAGVTAIFYNGALWEQKWLDHIFSGDSPRAPKPHAVVDDFEQLFDLIDSTDMSVAKHKLSELRLPALEPRKPPPLRIEPDWHPAVANLSEPTIILFDWHATLVDTLEAMYHAVDDMLLELGSLGLITRLLKPEQSKSPEDTRLVEYVKNYQQLHPKIKADRKISRTDIFEVLFGDDEEAKKIAHTAFNRHYRNHYGTVLPFEPKVKDMLIGLRSLQLQVGVITNRDREFFVHELKSVEGTGWEDLFDTDVCGDDTIKRKPHPDQILKAVTNLGGTISPNVWYVGDSTTDTIAAKTCGVTSVFFNGAQWDQPWLNKIFPGSARYPHKPDVVVNDFSEFWALVLACNNK